MNFLLKLFILFCVSILYAKCDTLKGTTISVVTLIEPPYTIIRKDTTLTGNERFEGYIIDVIDTLAKELDFKYVVYIQGDGKYGSSHNGEWDGLIGEVRSGRAKIGAAPITITSEREKVVDFTTPFMAVGISILYKRASDGKALPFTNVDELAALETTKFGCVRNGATYQFFATSENPTYKRIYERMLADPSTLVESVSQGIERVKTEDYAFFMESTSLEYVVDRNCDLQQVGGLLDLKGFGLAIEKDAPYREELSVGLLLLLERGDLALLKRKWWTNNNGEQCDHEES